MGRSQMTWPIESEGNDDSGINKISTKTLFRWFLYDIAGEDANDNIDIFDLSVVSPEGDEKELEESGKRLEAISGLSALLAFYADTTAEYAFAMHKKQLLAMTGITPEMLALSEEPLKEFYTTTAFSALASAFSAMAELDIIKIKSLTTEIKESRDE
jgi:hypothetical protein